MRCELAVQPFARSGQSTPSRAVGGGTVPSFSWKGSSAKKLKPKEKASRPTINTE